MWRYLDVQWPIIPWYQGSVCLFLMSDPVCRRIPNGYIQNYADIISKQLTMHGFIVSALAPAYTVEFYRVMIPLIKEGLIQYREDVSEGLETAEQGLLDVLKGRNIAKRVIIVADD